MYRANNPHRVGKPYYKSLKGKISLKKLNPILSQDWKLWVGVLMDLLIQTNRYNTAEYSLIVYYNDQHWFKKRSGNINSLRTSKNHKKILYQNRHCSRQTESVNYSSSAICEQHTDYPPKWPENTFILEETFVYVFKAVIHWIFHKTICDH